MPLKHFNILVKCQRQNGVKLVQGRQDGKAAREFIEFLAKSVFGKVSSIIREKDFIAVMSDGSQARKTGSDKELVLTHTKRGGVPQYFVTAILEMSQYGGVDAESLKRGIDDVYLNQVKLPEEFYLKHFVSTTTDGASQHRFKNWSLFPTENREALAGAYPFCKPPH